METMRLLVQFWTVFSKPSHRDTFANIFTFSVTPGNLRKMNLWGQMHAYIAEKMAFRGISMTKMTLFSPLLYLSVEIFIIKNIL